MMGQAGSIDASARDQETDEKVVYAGPSAYELMILGGLQHKPNMFWGSSSKAMELRVDKRRAKNRVARRSRRLNRIKAA